MLKFDDETTRLFEIAYQGADLTRRRQASFEALRPKPGETIMDIGCGNGLLTLELARAVGPDGRIVGIDPSADMLKSSTDRCASFEWIEIVDGGAYELPVPNASADKAVSVQVFEYLDDVRAAIAEIHRVLKPGGRAVISDMHFDTLAWFTEDRERMGRMLDAWDHHFVERCIPALLPAILRDTGFQLDGIVPFTLCDHDLKPDGLAIMMMRLMENYAVDNGHVSAPEARAWSDEQKALARVGRFFFSITHFVVSATKI
jgi:SAM-dependent methyltransferase